MRLAAAFLIALAAFGQALEIRGKVVEQGASIPIPGAEIKIFEVAAGNEFTLVATVFSDTNGRYSYAPQRLGSYRMEVRKQGYFSAQSASEDVARPAVYLTSVRPKQDVEPVTMMRPGTLTGRIVDEDRKPVVGLQVYAQVTPSIRGSGREAVTGDDGTFRITGLSPQGYFVRIAPPGMDVLDVEEPVEAFKEVHRDIETVYWPSVPMPVPTGGIADVGTIALHMVPYYRARVRFDGACEEGEKWLLTLVRLPFHGRAVDNAVGGTNCRSEFLLSGLLPGSYLLGASTTAKENTRWATTPLVITSENAEATLRFSPTADLTARVVVPSGVTSIGSAKVSLQLRPENGLPVRGGLGFESDTDGRFSMHNIPWPRHMLLVQGVPRTHYVKEIRYGGQAVTDFMVPTSGGGHIDIVLDDRPATIKGKASGYTPNENILAGGFVMIAREGYRDPLVGEPFVYRIPVGANGAFEARGLAPGEYRVHVKNGIMRDLPEAGGLLVRISAGETKTVEVSVQ